MAIIALVIQSGRPTRCADVSMSQADSRLFDSQVSMYLDFPIEWGTTLHRKHDEDLTRWAATTGETAPIKTSTRCVSPMEAPASGYAGRHGARPVRALSVLVPWRSPAHTSATLPFWWTSIAWSVSWKRVWRKYRCQAHTKPGEEFLRRRGPGKATCGRSTTPPSTRVSKPWIENAIEHRERPKARRNECFFRCPSRARRRPSNSGRAGHRRRSFGGFRQATNRHSPKHVPWVFFPATSEQTASGAFGTNIAGFGRARVHPSIAKDVRCWSRAIGALAVSLSFFATSLLRPRPCCRGPTSASSNHPRSRAARLRPRKRTGTTWRFLRQDPRRYRGVRACSAPRSVPP